jgi:periplasmic divalent cation tolerance protein
MQPVLLYITASDKQEAQRLANALLEAQLIACANILPGVLSFYRWEGRLCEAEECLIFAKTSEECLPEAIEMVKKLHSYDCPCILALPVQAGYPPFLQWAEEQLERA